MSGNRRARSRLRSIPGPWRRFRGIPLPVETLRAGAVPSLVREADRIRDRISQIEAARQDEPDRLETMRQRRAARLGVSLDREPTPDQQALLEHISRLIEDEYLRGISLPVRERFSDAMSAWSQAQQQQPGDVPFIERFALMAAVLTRPGDISADQDRR